MKAQEYIRENFKVHGRTVRWLSNSSGLRPIPTRWEYIKRFGFSVPDEGIIETVAEHGPLLEIGAGLGYWSYEVEQAGGKIIATDIGETKRWPWEHDYWCDVEKISALDAVNTYPDHNLLVVWPSYDETWAYEALEASTCEYVLYVGEYYEGCTADVKFHRKLFTEFDVRVVPMMQFDAIHDDLYVCKRK